MRLREQVIKKGMAIAQQVIRIHFDVECIGCPEFKSGRAIVTPVPSQVNRLVTGFFEVRSGSQAAVIMGGLQIALGLLSGKWRAVKKPSWGAQKVFLSRVSVTCLNVAMTHILRIGPHFYKESSLDCRARNTDPKCGLCSYSLRQRAS